MEKSHQYNIDILKFLAAILVIVSHAHALNQAGGDILSRITGGSWDFGNLAVTYFFLVSGFYISRSAKKSQSAKQFFVKCKI